MIKRRRFFKKKKVKTGQLIKSNQKTVFLIFIFIIGVFSGAFAVKNADAQLMIKIKELTENYLELKSSGSILKIFISAAVTDFFFIAISSIFGMSLIGAPVLWLLPAVRGLGIGVILGYIYSNYNISGLIYGIITICIPTALSACALIISCKESLLTVKDLQQSFSRNKEFNSKQYYKLFFLRNIILYMIMLFAAAIGSVVVLIPSITPPN